MRPLTPGLLVGLVGLTLLVAANSARSHDAARPELNKWFDSLASGKGPCCSVTDGAVVRDPDWQSRDGHYSVRIDGEWIDVPDDALIKQPNLAGQTMVWVLRASNLRGDKLIMIRCFIPGSMT